MLGELIKLANHLDSIGYSKEADYLDLIIKRVANDDPPYYDKRYDTDGDGMLSEEEIKKMLGPSDLYEYMRKKHPNSPLHPDLSLSTEDILSNKKRLYEPTISSPSGKSFRTSKEVYDNAKLNVGEKEYSLPSIDDELFDKGEAAHSIADGLAKAFIWGAAFFGGNEKVNKLIKGMLNTGKATITLTPFSSPIELDVDLLYNKLKLYELQKEGLTEEEAKKRLMLQDSQTIY